MVILNETRELVIAQHVRTARRFLERLRGLIGTTTLGQGEGLWLPGCQGVHTFGMAFAIDVLYLDQQNRIVQIVPYMPPHRFGPVVWKAAGVLELPAGTLDRYAIGVGRPLVFLEVKPEGTAEP